MAVFQSQEKTYRAVQVTREPGAHSCADDLNAGLGSAHPWPGAASSSHRQPEDKAAGRVRSCPERHISQGLLCCFADEDLNDDYEVTARQLRRAADARIKLWFSPPRVSSSRGCRWNAGISWRSDAV